MGFKLLFLIEWSPIISCKLLFLLGVTKRLLWNASDNSRFNWKTSKYLFSTLGPSFLLYVTRQGILSVLLFSFLSYQIFLISIVYLIYLLFQDVLSLSSFDEFLLQYCTIFFFFHIKWLWMVWMCMEIWLLISGFVVDSSLKRVILVFIYQCVQKWYIIV